MDALQQAWAILMQLAAGVASLGALGLVIAGEVWVGRNMVRGWRDRSGWWGMVAAAADLDHQHPREPAHRKWT